MTHINILFAQKPESPDMTFIEVEDDAGFNINVGEWITKGGYQVLRIERPEPDMEGGAGWFDMNASTVGGKVTFTAHEVATLLRGQKPFGNGQGEVKA